MKSLVNKFLFLSVISVLYLSCSSANFSQTALDHAELIKPEALALMDNAADSYNDYKVEVEQLMQKVDNAYQFAKSRENNDEAAKQWEVLKNPEGNLLGGFMSRWKFQEELSESFINVAKDLVRDAFDEIIELEESKK